MVDLLMSRGFDGGVGSARGYVCAIYMEVGKKKWTKVDGTRVLEASSARWRLLVHLWSGVVCCGSAADISTRGAQGEERLRGTATEGGQVCTETR